MRYPGSPTFIYRQGNHRICISILLALAGFTGQELRDRAWNTVSPRPEASESV